MTDLYELVGGTKWFAELVERFYEGVWEDPLLRPLYPEDNPQGAIERLTGFLVQYWGGPTDYSDARGHPRLRQRHFPYRIGVAERDRWVYHMKTAVSGDGSLDKKAVEAVLEYFERAATAMINTEPASENERNT